MDAPPSLPPPPVDEAVPLNHIEWINAYYDSFRVAPCSIRAPDSPYIKQSTNSKKRKRLSKRSSLPAGSVLPSTELLTKLELARQKCLPVLSTMLPHYVQKASTSSTDGRTPTPTFDTIDILHHNPSGKEDMFLHQKHQYVLPRHSSFFLGDVFHLPPLPSTFRFIVMDPPWENKTVARGASYTTMSHTRLADLDIPAMAHPDGCILAIWVTNKPAYTAYILDTLLPLWGFTLAQTWHWLKVSADGECVTPLQSTHKLPFEKVIFATRGNIAGASIRPKILVSIPLRHSWKPPLEPLLADVITTDEPKLEIFARELRPHWTCVGNEVRC
ncbi:Aste57867_400 [Aphanomyces stellatus]|uniref:Aste57867_400 protein n=1 Tax=Aphanomyces stellatus TaxID=120398 RepID=A0A485K3I2_9STRA|nr:hypothetical protein As57867_000399 [Aphanomyces stellatus]VFT77625.1 Aste57867_400 [Aphanomyces stellatus]